MTGTEAITLSVVAPAYNEAENIESVIRSWEQTLNADGIRSEIVIGDGGSTDGTLDILARLQKESPSLVVVRSERSGYGCALFAAIARSRGEYVVMLDSDAQFDLADYRKALALLKTGYDAVTGYRLGKKDTILKIVADRGLNLMVRLLFKVKQRDTNCALKIFRGKLIRQLRIDAVSWATPTEIMIRLHHGGARVAEIGVNHYERPAGDSKLRTFRVAWQMLWFLVYFRIKISLVRAQVAQEL